jgi:hypothetical protein
MHRSGEIPAFVTIHATTDIKCSIRVTVEVDVDLGVEVEVDLGVDVEVD